MTAKELIDARPETVGALITFSSNPDTISVPTYQRPYQWDTSRVLDLMKLSDPDSREFGFIGTMVFVRNKEQRLEVVDGQQRLITIILILCAFRDFLTELTQRSTDKPVADMLDAMRMDIQSDSLLVSKIYSSVEAKPRITFSRTTYGVFENIYLRGLDGFEVDDDVERQESNAFAKNYENVKRYLQDKYNHVPTRNMVILLDARLNKLKGLVVNAIYIGRQEFAGEVFESINGTGVNLKLSELVKNYIFRNLGESAVETKWAEITKNCDQKNELVENIIKYDWQSRFDITDDFEIFRSIRTNTPDVEQYFDRLVRLSKILSFYFHPSTERFKVLKLKDNSNDKNHIIKQASVLRMLGVKQFLRLIFALDGLRDHMDIKQYARLLDALVNFQVRAKIAAVPTNSIDSLYSSLAKTLVRLRSDIESGQIPQAKARERLTTELFDSLPTSLKKLSPDVEFIDAFARLERPRTKKDLFKYVLGKIENHLQRTELIIDTLDNQTTLEEIYPQHPALGWSKSDCLPDDIYKIGNATILRGRDNRLASNATIEEKVDVYRQSKLRINEDLVKSLGEPPLTWSTDAIKGRGSQLAEIAGSIWTL